MNYFKLKITGDKDNATILKEILCSHYNYNKKQFGIHDRHFFGLKECDVIEEEDNSIVCVGYLEQDGYQTFSNKSLSFKRHSRRGVHPITKKNVLVPFHGTSMESETSNIKCEIFVEGEHFHQHLIFENGKLVFLDTASYESVYWDREQFSSLEAINKSIFPQMPFSENQYNVLTGCLERGGFDWEFDLSPDVSLKAI